MVKDGCFPLIEGGYHLLEGIINLLKVFQTVPLTGEFFLLVFLELGLLNLVHLVTKHVQALRPLLLVGLFLVHGRLELSVTVVEFLVLLKEGWTFL